MARYNLEFILQVNGASLKTLKNSLVEFCENIDVQNSEEKLAQGEYFKVKLETDDPTLVFDACAQFGRIKSAKVDEIE